MIARPPVWTTAKIVARSHARHRVKEIVLVDVKKHAAEDVKVLTRMKGAQTVADHVRTIVQEAAKMLVRHHVPNHALNLVRMAAKMIVQMNVWQTVKVTVL